MAAYGEVSPYNVQRCKRHTALSTDPTQTHTRDASTFDDLKYPSTRSGLAYLAHGLDYYHIVRDHIKLEAIMKSSMLLHRCPQHLRSVAQLKVQCAKKRVQQTAGKCDQSETVEGEKLGASSAYVQLSSIPVLRQRGFWKGFTGMDAPGQHCRQSHLMIEQGRILGEAEQPLSCTSSEPNDASC